jgi:hypothetical protein
MQKVYPISEGELLYYKDSTENPILPDYGTGDFILIEQMDKIRTYYYHLIPGSIQNSLKHVTPDTELAISGNSGHSSGAHLHFSAENADGDMINPLDILPVRADNEKPSIHRLLFVINDKPPLSLMPGNRKIHWRREIKLYIIAWDRKEGVDRRIRLTPYFARGIRKLSLFIDDSLFRSYNFSKLIRSQNGLCVTPSFPHDEIYGNPYNYKFGEFTPSKKRHIFEIRCEDFNGNSSKKYYYITFY